MSGPLRVRRALHLLLLALLGGLPGCLEITRDTTTSTGTTVELETSTTFGTTFAVGGDLTDGSAPTASAGETDTDADEIGPAPLADRDPKSAPR